eukprot:7991703-Ditylum_brightwellii.AAC.1
MSTQFPPNDGTQDVVPDGRGVLLPASDTGPHTSDTGVPLTAQDSNSSLNWSGTTMRKSKGVMTYHVPSLVPKPELFLRHQGTP